ncbi:MAG: bifunctional (p)ppGpp synthetase/guanosine-3',5'-bis(diphosphate) 3'-pyrophosphohydrolase [Rhodocyclaceae bacterium]|nr:bifunctional (p)ppGpp synthetase/guanosine-3',5'-bis(diphosphate) 3'-pyrophosphohydrolase [Rhodocyclaceae bacterium]MBL0076622.1 bifunctional (p)ppGpp synthetase/guanosine-3',5'-bis(diphosphate) 3'-pyrophosphohydrolase [Rhodocyclaceae bacterium]MBP6110614.1 bifunctional (p)ppGpp synthetase/guanosine-3',5'-bis(diphosphate) 3'-pyrophosphohydrolase [Rhodocyclaceae bacterium]MBP6279601.1 bifunctional (p)ppGpp synthetase/guanosine-3',5'-bis(diphosphate) 3'-pyrophosphohydrolase [Rhodocyclaceae bact
MVSVTHSLTKAGDDAAARALLVAGLPDERGRWLDDVLSYAMSLYGEAMLGTGELTRDHAIGMCLTVAGLELDADARAAALLFSVADHHLTPELGIARLERDFGSPVAQLVGALARLKSLRPLTRAASSGQDANAQAEVLRKMLLAMSVDIRVVLLRIASRVQTLRHLADAPGLEREELAKESLAIYSPLANRLGVWQLKWELEDLSFRFLEPQTYKRIAGLLDEKRVEREDFIRRAVAQLSTELAAIHVAAEVYGRPKHIYSIWNKMRGKRLDFAQVYDVRALRVLVDDVDACYAALGVVHHIWSPIAGEFDDYISQPKGNFYQSLHTAVTLADGRSLEVQIRTREMHQHAEMGVAAHWRYKELGASDGGGRNDTYGDKIAWLRQLLSWRDEISDSGDWAREFKRAALDDTIYVLTPQGRVLDMTRGATPVDVAYRLHTDLGHRCRGARVDGAMVPLNTVLQNGQQVEIIAAKSGGPSRDWLSVENGYLASARARQKARQWFAAADTAEQLTQGRAIVMREVQRESQGHLPVSLDELATRLGVKSAEAMFVSAARGEIGPRALQIALRGTNEAPPTDAQIVTRKSRAKEGDILIVGVDKLLTQMGRCCKPMPPDAIAGFVTRGRGISIHRIGCRDFRIIADRHPERVIEAGWGANTEKAQANESGVYAADLVVTASDRQGLLRDISEILMREKINVTATRTQSKGGNALMQLTIELSGKTALQRVITSLSDVAGVIAVRRD